MIGPEPQSGMSKKSIGVLDTSGALMLTGLVKVVHCFCSIVLYILEYSCAAGSKKE